MSTPFNRRWVANEWRSTCTDTKEVDEVDPDGVFRLLDLPILAVPAPFEFLAESARPVCERFVGGRTSEE